MVKFESAGTHSLSSSHIFPVPFVASHLISVHVVASYHVPVLVALSALFTKGKGLCQRPTNAKHSLGEEKLPLC
ncbi:hypothetical protein AAC387_Pa04g0537 [Persea americana]